MSRLIYSTGYCVSPYEIEEFISLSNILQMEILLMREQKENNYQLKPLSIMQLRGIHADEMVEYLIERCQEIMYFLQIGDVLKVNEQCYRKLLLKYSNAEDCKILDQLFQTVKDNCYGTSYFYTFTLEQHSFLSEERKESLINSFTRTMRHVSSITESSIYMECRLSDNSYIIPIHYDCLYEMTHIFSELLGNFSLFYDAIIRKERD